MMCDVCCIRAGRDFNGRALCHVHEPRGSGFHEAVEALSRAAEMRNVKSIKTAIGAKKKRGKTRTKKK